MITVSLLLRHWTKVSSRHSRARKLLTRIPKLRWRVVPFARRSLILVRSVLLTLLVSHVLFVFILRRRLRCRTLLTVIPVAFRLVKILPSSRALMIPIIRRPIVFRKLFSMLIGIGFFRLNFGHSLPLSSLVTGLLFLLNFFLSLVTRLVLVWLLWRTRKLLVSTIRFLFIMLLLVRMRSIVMFRLSSLIKCTLVVLLWRVMLLLRPIIVLQTFRIVIAPILILVVVLVLRLVVVLVAKLSGFVLIVSQVIPKWMVYSRWRLMVKFIPVRFLFSIRVLLLQNKTTLKGCS